MISVLLFTRCAFGVCGGRCRGVNHAQVLSLWQDCANCKSHGKQWNCKFTTSPKFGLFRGLSKKQPQSILQTISAMILHVSENSHVTCNYLDCENLLARSCTSCKIFGLISEEQRKTIKILQNHQELRRPCKSCGRIMD